MHLQIDVTRRDGLHGRQPPGRDRLRHRPQLKDAITEPPGRRGRPPGHRPARGRLHRVHRPRRADRRPPPGARAQGLAGPGVHRGADAEDLPDHRPRQGVRDPRDRGEARSSSPPTEPPSRADLGSRTEPLAEAARLRRPGVVPEALAPARSRPRSYIAIASGCSVPVSSTITSAPACARRRLQVREHGAREPAAAAAGRRTSASPRPPGAAERAHVGAQPPAAHRDRLAVDVPDEERARAAGRTRRRRAGCRRGRRRARRTPPAPRATSRCASGWVNATADDSARVLIMCPRSVVGVVADDRIGGSTLTTRSGHHALELTPR